MQKKTRLRVGGSGAALEKGGFSISSSSSLLSYSRGKRIGRMCWENKEDEEGENKGGGKRKVKIFTKC